MKRLILFFALATVVLAQTTINGGRTITGAWDASGAATTKAVKSGTSLPGTCAVGEFYNKSDEVAGLTLYACTATNTWTRAAYSQGTTNPATCTLGQVFFDTDATAGSNLQLCTATNTWTAVSGGGGGAPTDAQYVTLAVNASLSAERTLDARDNLDLTDAGANGNASLDFTPMDRSVLWLKDEFMSYPEGSELGWKTMTTGTYTNVVGEADHPGIRQIETAATTDSFAGLFLGLYPNDARSLINLGGVAGWEYETIVRVPTTTTVNIGVGISNDVVHTYASKIMVRYVAASMSTWEYYTCIAGTCTSTDSTVTVTTGWFRFRIRSTTAGTVLFSINGGSETAITTNLPSGLVSPIYYIETKANAARSVQIDWFAMKWRGLGR